MLEFSFNEQGKVDPGVEFTTQERIDRTFTIALHGQPGKRG